MTNALCAHLPYSWRRTELNVGSACRRALISIQEAPGTTNIVNSSGLCAPYSLRCLPFGASLLPLFFYKAENQGCVRACPRMVGVFGYPGASKTSDFQNQYTGCVNLGSGPAHTWHPIGQLTVRALLRPASKTGHQHIPDWIYALNFEIQQCFQL